jgi:ATPase subunit of ABC transporter with duplicated ATPase domains
MDLYRGYGMVCQTPDASHSGKIFVLGKEMGKVDLFELRTRIGLAGVGISEDIPFEEKVRDVVVTAAYAVLGRWNEDYDLWDESRAVALLTTFGVRDLADRAYGTLSEGKKKRVQISRALMADPELLLLDEPTNDLDIVTLQTLEEFLLDFQGCVLIVSHDRYFLDRLVDHVFAFEGNGVVKDFPGNYSEYRQWKFDSEDELEELEREAKKQKAQETKVEEVAKPVLETPLFIEKKKRSYKEEKELEGLESELPELEKKKIDIENKLASGLTDANEIEKLSSQFSFILKSIDEKTMRWLELQD